MSGLPVLISRISCPRQIRRFFDSEMDLIQNYYSESEEETPSVNAQTPPPAVQGQSVDVQEPSAEAPNDPEMSASPHHDPESAKIARKKKKKEFRAKIEKMIIKDQFKCNFCTTICNRRTSLERSFSQISARYNKKGNRIICETLCNLHNSGRASREFIVALKKTCQDLGISYE